MKKVIPEKVTHYCDRCGIVVDHKNRDAVGNVEFVGRDFAGHAVGGNRVDFEFCPTCTNEFNKFLHRE